MALRTTAELAEAILRGLGVIDAEEDVPDEDEEFIIDVYEAKHAELAAPGRELAYWTVDEIPAAVFLPLRNLMMMEVQGAYGEPIDPAEKEAREAILLRPFHRHTSIEKSGIPSQSAADFF